MHSLILIWALTGQVAEPDLQAEVDALVRQLDADDLATKKAAQEKLTEMGTKVLPLLPQIDAQTPAEVKIRLGIVRNQLEKQIAEKATQGSRVTLSGSMKLSEVLSACS